MPISININETANIPSVIFYLFVFNFTNCTPFLFTVKTAKKEAATSAASSKISNVIFKASS